MRYKNLFFYIFLMSTLTSCGVFQRGNDEASNDLNYMKNIEEVAVDASLKSSHNTIQPADQLVILVSGRDLDVVKPFNQNYSSGEMIQSSQAGGNTPGQGSAAIAGPTYIVDSNGNIDFPIIGRLDTTGKTVEEFKAELRGRLTRYIISPVVSMRLANHKITVLGEVNRPGEYTVADGKATLLSALGMAGDLTMYGKRDDVLVVRNVDGQISKERINLADAGFINSPYYNLKQGDVIYVSANKTKEKTSKLDPNMPIYISVASIVVTILALVIKK